MSDPNVLTPEWLEAHATVAKYVTNDDRYMVTVEFTDRDESQRFYNALTGEPDTSDIPELTEEWFKRARLELPEKAKAGLWPKHKRTCEFARSDGHLPCTCGATRSAYNWGGSDMRNQKKEP